jgi:hypothetical protein
VSQKENATAASTQVAPTNLNIVIRIDSPGDEGPVTQTNTSVASATGNNSNAVAQGAAQNQTGAGQSGGQSQSADQTAPTTQGSTATAASTQTAPLNANIVIRNKSPGDSGPVTQTNSSQATAQAANDNAVNQSATQAQTLAGDSSAGGQSQSVRQSAPTTQDANATATSNQTSPTNANVSVLIDGAAPDPAGSGAQGLWIQIWIPFGDQRATAPANSSSANASAVNSNQVSQSATQQQSGGSGGGSQMGGAGQSQTIEQSASTTQTASAQAAAAQGAGSGTSSAGATQTNSNQTVQSAQQAGSGAQVIEQSAPCVQYADLTLTVGSGASAVDRSGWSLEPSARIGAARWGAPDQGSAASPMPQSRGSHSRGTRHPAPFPHAPKLPNASLAGTPDPGGSHGTFGVLFLAFALTAPWWARRHLPSAFRRLMAVVSRLERPG